MRLSGFVFKKHRSSHVLFSAAPSMTNIFKFLLFYKNGQIFKHSGLIIVLSQFEILARRICHLCQGNKVEIYRVNGNHECCSEKRFL